MEKQTATSPIGSFQLFGLDFLVSDSGTVFLLEANRNPALHTPVPLLRATIPKVVADAVEIVEAVHGLVEGAAGGSAAVARGETNHGGGEAVSSTKTISSVPEDLSWLPCGSRGVFSPVYCGDAARVRGKILGTVTVGSVADEHDNGVINNKRSPEERERTRSDQADHHGRIATTKPLQGAEQAERPSNNDAEQEENFVVSSSSSSSSQMSLQKRFSAFRKYKQTEIRTRSASSTDPAPSSEDPPHPGLVSRRRELFLQSLRKYLGRSYDDVDCCALLKVTTRDLFDEHREIWGDWCLGERNQSYQFALTEAVVVVSDSSGAAAGGGGGEQSTTATAGMPLVDTPPGVVLSPVVSDSVSDTRCDRPTDHKEPKPPDLLPGDLIFYEGKFTDPTKKPCVFDIVHVEVFVGPEKQTLGARNRETGVAIHDSFDFDAKIWTLKKIHFRSLAGWLQGRMPRFCDELRERAERAFPVKCVGRRSVFGGGDQ